MAYIDHKVTSFSNPVADLADKPNMSASALKAWFDSNSGEMQTAHNDLIDELTADKGTTDSDISSINESIDTIEDTLDEHLADTSNPHDVTKTQIGLGNVDNTSDVNKPISTATQTALGLKADKTELHTHTNKIVLDGITSTKISNWDSAYADKHTHSNKSTLDGITSSLITAWNGAVTDKHTHSNKALLDGITADKINTLPTLAEASIDTFYEGIAKVAYNIDTATTGEGEHLEGTYLIIAETSFALWDGERDGDTIYKQTKYIAGGKIMVRQKAITSSAWNDWVEYKPDIDLSTPVTTAGTSITSYTCKTNKVYKINKTNATVVTLTLDTPSNANIRNEIEIYYQGTTDNIVGWNSVNIKFENDTTPSFAANHHYRILAEWHPIMGKWIVTVKDDGVIA